jgi:hypothetical protein
MGRQFLYAPIGFKVKYSKRQNGPIDSISPRLLAVTPAWGTKAISKA